MAGVMICMRNFPASWLSTEALPRLPMKIKNLLEKFGPLKSLPEVHGVAPKVQSFAVFEDDAAALSAVKTLHGVDNRTAPEKEGKGEASPEERFWVQTAAKTKEADQKASSLAVASVKANGVRLWELPPDWVDQDVQEICSQYGIVKSMTNLPNGGGCEVIFDTQVAAETAASELHNLEFHNEDNSVTTLRCGLLSKISANGNIEAAPTEPKKEVAAPAKPESLADQLQSALQQQRDKLTPAPTTTAASEKKKVLIMYVDELHVPVGEPGPEDRELFIRDLPLEDYTEAELREWLAGFGAVEEVTFLRDDTGALAGNSYVRYKAHADAAGLVAAFPRDEAAEEGSVQGSWSLSERMQRARTDARSHPEVAGVVAAVERHLPSLREEVGCPGLKLLQDAGPLHFQARLEDGCDAPEAMRSRLSEILKAEIEAAGDALRARLEGGSDTSGDEAPAEAETAPTSLAPPGTPCVLIRGFASTWQEQQVKLLFTLFGGVSKINFVKEAGGARVAVVELKNPENLPKAASHLHNTQVGDGELIEECVITCEVKGMDAETKTQIMTVFIDELDMPKRPKVEAAKTDKEVFLKSLPIHDCKEEQIKDWLEDFGTAEDVLLLRDPVTNELTGTGYTRFSSHEEAVTCIEQNVGDGDVAASWSEAERASQKIDSVYGADVHQVFAGIGGRVLESLRKTAKAEKIWLFSEQYKGRDPQGPEPKNSRLHFQIECTHAGLANAKGAMARTLEAFHEKVQKRLSKEADAKLAKNAYQKPTQNSSSEPANDVPPGTWQSNPWSQQQPAYPSAPQASWAYPAHPGQGAYGYGYPGAPPPRPAYGAPPGAQPNGSFAYGAPPGANAWLADPKKREQIEKGEGLIEQGRGARSKEQYEKAYQLYCAGLQDLFQAMPEDEHHPLRQKMNVYLEEAEKLKELTAIQKASSDKKDVELEKPLVKEADQKANRAPSGSLEKDRRGRRRRKDRDDDKDEENDQRHGDRDRERHKKRRKKDRGDKDDKEDHDKGERADAPPSPPAAPPVAKQREPSPSPEARRAPVPLETEEAAPNEPEEATAKDGVAEEEGKRKKKRKKKDKGEPEESSAAIPKEMADQIERSEALIIDAKEAEDGGDLDTSYSKYCTGLQDLLEVMPKLPEDNPKTPFLRLKISAYLEQAELLKGRLEKKKLEEAEAEANAAASRKEEEEKADFGEATSPTEANDPPEDAPPENEKEKEKEKEKSKSRKKPRRLRIDRGKKEDKPTGSSDPLPPPKSPASPPPPPPPEEGGASDDEKDLPKDRSASKSGSPQARKHLRPKAAPGPPGRDGQRSRSGSGSSKGTPPREEKKASRSKSKRSRSRRSRRRVRIDTRKKSPSPGRRGGGRSPPGRRSSSPRRREGDRSPPRRSPSPGRRGKGRSPPGRRGGRSRSRDRRGPRSRSAGRRGPRSRSGGRRGGPGRRSRSGGRR